MDPFLLILMGSALWYFTSRSSSKAVVVAPIKKPAPGEPKPVIVKITPAAPASVDSDTIIKKQPTLGREIVSGRPTTIIKKQPTLGREIVSGRPTVDKPQDIAGGQWVWKVAGAGGNWIWVPYSVVEDDSQ